MKEGAVVERYIFQALKSIAAGYGWPPPQIAPFVLGEGASDYVSLPVPTFYFRSSSALDRNPIGPGPRLVSALEYEIGVFHAGISFGATLPTNGGSGSVSLLTVIGQIDDLFQNYTPPIINTGLGGTVYSIERVYPVRLSERSGAKLFRRDGGVYRFVVEAD